MTKQTKSEVQAILKQLSDDRKFRKRLTSESHRWFFTTYFSDFIKYPTADFQIEMFELSEDDSIDLAVIVAFRGSGKSTIMSHSYPIWAMLGKLQKKYIVVISQTRQQAGQILVNIKRELESNELLIRDYGPFKEEADLWRSDTLIIPGLETRITSLSVGENIRGLRHKSTRPDLIICDDVESLESVKTRDGRNNTFKWFTGDVVPAGDLGTKTVVIGNLLHEDSLVMRLKENIESKKLQGVYKEYPLLKNSKTLWKGKFPSKESINTLKSKIGDEISWQREYLLTIVPEEDRVIFRNWIQYYSDLPSTEAKDYMFSVTGVDLAISEKETADYTSAVSCHVFGSNQDWQIYVLPSPINKRMNFPQTVSTMKNLKSSFGYSHHLCIENVAYQKALLDHLENQGIPVEGIPVGKQDKRSRLALTAAAIKSGKVLFPKKGCVELIDQIVNFGIEKHDDLADAFTLMMFKVFEECNQPEPKIHIIDWGPSYFRGLSDDRPVTLDTIF